MAHINPTNMGRVTVNTRMVNQNWWITTLLINSHEYCPPLARDIECDVLIVGGGFSGISAAAEFLRHPFPCLRPAGTIPVRLHP